MKTTNSSFRSRSERDIVRTLLAENRLEAALIAVGVGAEAAREYMDDPNAVPTSVRKLLVERSTGCPEEKYADTPWNNCPAD